MSHQAIHQPIDQPSCNSPLTASRRCCSCAASSRWSRAKGTKACKDCLVIGRGWRKSSSIHLSNLYRFISFYIVLYRSIYLYKIHTIVYYILIDHFESICLSIYLSIYPSIHLRACFYVTDSTAVRAQMRASKRATAINSDHHLMSKATWEWQMQYVLRDTPCIKCIETDMEPKICKMMFTEMTFWRLEMDWQPWHFLSTMDTTCATCATLGSKPSTARCLACR